MAISIHAPREGGDSGTCPHWRDCCYFNPRPPRGGRLPSSVLKITGIAKISIHAPREGGDPPLTAAVSRITISIHAPREGGDI